MIVDVDGFMIVDVDGSMVCDLMTVWSFDNTEFMCFVLSNPTLKQENHIQTGKSFLYNGLSAGY